MDEDSHTKRAVLLRLADFISESTIDATSVKPLTPFPGTSVETVILS
jgi:hypothetical protein